MTDLAHRADTDTTELLPADWRTFRANASRQRDQLERSLRRLLAHDPRAGSPRPGAPSARELADEALAWALDTWRSKPSDMSPEHWMRKHGLRLLEDALNRDAESRRPADVLPEPARLASAEAALADLLTDDSERARWLELAQPASCDETIDLSIPGDATEARLFETERIEDLERALLRLPELRRRVVTHHHLDGMSVDEVGDLLELTRDDVVRELSAATKAIRLDLGLA